MRLISLSPVNRKCREQHSDEFDLEKRESTREFLPSEPSKSKSQACQAQTAKPRAVTPERVVWPWASWNKTIRKCDPRRKLILTAICEHHRYRDAKVHNPTPMRYADIIDATRHEETGAPRLSAAVISEIVQDQFKAGYKGYKYLCRTGQIGSELQRLLFEMKDHTDNGPARRLSVADPLA